MGNAEKPKLPPDKQMSDRRRTEIDYHRKLNSRFVFSALPGFVFYAIVFFYRGSYFQGVIYFVLSLNAVVTLLWALRIKELKNLVLLKQIGSAIAFGLFAFSLLFGVLSKDIYIFFPWLYIYPVAVLLMFGERIGIFFSLGFCLVAGIATFVLDLPPWTDSAIQIFKLSSALALISTLSIALISERTRVRMRNNLLEARNKYKEAEEHLRETNAELKSEIEMRVQSEKALAQSETRYRALFEESSVSLWEEDYSKVKIYLDELPQEAADDLTTYLKQNPSELSKSINSIWVTAVNRATLNLYGAQSKPEMLKNIWRILPSDLMTYMAERFTALYLTRHFDTQVSALTLNGRKLHLLVSSTIPAGYEESWAKVYTSVYDATERVALEEERKRVDRQLQHGQQIQAIASLAGGIAHQFNNALAVICGNVDLLELNVQGHMENLRFINALRTSSERMSRLTEQLLAYAQGGKYQPKAFSANDLIRDLLRTNKMARSPGLKVTTCLDPELFPAAGDITQIKIVLEAVLTNAVEAMNSQGEIAIATCNQTFAHNTSLPPGNYAVIVIEDHGIGMDEQTLQRIFEPFFTTKFVGRGLGMAAAFGIVRNHDGMIAVESEPNKGTRVKIYFPCEEKPKDHAMDDPTRQAA